MVYGLPPRHRKSRPSFAARRGAAALELSDMDAPVANRGGRLSGLERQSPKVRPRALRRSAHSSASRHVTDMWGVGHGFWMGKSRVVESRICRGNGGFGL